MNIGLYQELSGQLLSEYFGGNRSAVLKGGRGLWAVGESEDH